MIYPPLPPYDDTRHSQLGGVTQYSPEDMHAYIAPVLAERDALREQARVLREALDSIDSIESWGAYASEYFQGKHKLRDELAQHALAATKPATDNL